MTARLATLLVLAMLALAATASSGSAAGPARAPILGVVPHTALPAPAMHTLSKAKALGAAGPAGLTFDARYESLINQYFTDVAADSGTVKNVYSVATQYSNIQYQSTFGGSYVSKAPLPANGCSDGFDTYCLTDQQLQQEIQTVLAAKGWQGGLDHIFFLMTPNDVGSCEFGGPASVGNPCSTNAFCAYHSGFGTPAGQDVIYANEPYMGPSGGCIYPGVQGFPNDVDSDTTINTISHEHNEAITDPLGTGWVEGDGTENGDLCAYGFGDPLGGTPGTSAYNQVINTHHYELQQEFSNQARPPDGGCVQFLGGPATPPPLNDGTGPLPYNGGPVMHTNTTYAIYWLPTPGNTTLPAVTGTVEVKQKLTSSPGSWNGAPTSYAYQWQRCSASGTGCVDISGATSATYRLTTADGGHTVRSTVHATNANGASQPVESASTAPVIDVPTATRAPHISGHPHVGKKLSGSHGHWTYSPTSYRYQWLRCNAHGAHCSRIHHATHPAYKLTHHDLKHRLRLRITAVNAVGHTVATSAATPRVH